MKSIRRELQEFLENEVRKAKNWSVNKVVDWDDIVWLANNHPTSSIKHPVYDRKINSIFNDCIDIDHIEVGGRGFIEYCENVAKENVSTILTIIERYRGIVLTDY